MHNPILQVVHKASADNCFVFPAFVSPMFTCVVEILGREIGILPDRYLHQLQIQLYYTLSWVRRIHSGLSPSRSRLNPRPLHMGFVVDKAAVEKDFFP